MTTASSDRFQKGVALRWPAIVATELHMKLRDTGAPILLACVAALCILLTPPADANYSVITFGGLKPVISAGTSIFSAGIVVSLLMFPLCALGLNVGCARDRRLGTGTLLATSGVNQITLLTGRIVANAILMLAFVLLTLGLVIAVTASRLHSLPDATCLAAFFLVVIPSGLCGLLAGAVMDRCLANSDGAKALVTFVVWSTLMVLSVVARPDCFGLQLLRTNAPRGASSNFAVGIVAAEHLGRVAWTTLTLPAAVLRSTLFLAAVILAGAIPTALWPGFLESLSVSVQYPAVGAVEPVIPTTEMPRVRPRKRATVSTAWVLTQRLLKRGGWVRALFFTALAAALFAPKTPRVSLTIALLIPLAIANARRMPGEGYVRQFELSNCSMWRPSPLILTALVLSTVTLIPTFPALVVIPLVQTVQIAAAVAAMTMWLTWTSTGLVRPLLGISVYALIWYVECFGDIKAPADLLGFSGTSCVALSFSMACALTLSITLFRRDLHAFRSSRYV